MGFWECLLCQIAGVAGLIAGCSVFISLWPICLLCIDYGYACSMAIALFCGAIGAC